MDITCEVHPLADFAPTDGEKEGAIVAARRRSRISFRDHRVEVVQEGVESIFISCASIT